MKTFAQFKSEIRESLFPSGEPSNLVTPHNKSFIDSLIDLQTFVECLQQDNTSVFPHCATYYNCGLTVLDAPRGNIKKVSVIDTTSEGDSDWCTEIEYMQVNPVHIREYLHRSLRCGFCLPTTLFFGLPNSCIKGYYPIASDEGVPAGLPTLPLGYHYPQTSTDRTYGRAGHGVWAIERGKIFIAPYIQSSEIVLVKWDGIKRTWAEGDPVDEDPLLAQAVLEYVRWQHTDRYDKDEAEAQRAMGAYNNARTLLMHQCREENRVRDREPSYARGTPASMQGMTLFYNEEVSYSASCPDGTGTVTVTIPAGTVSSSVSVADANQKAQDEAVVEATARLDCQSEPTTTYSNDAQTAVAACQAGQGAPPAEGNPVTVTIPAGTVTSSVSKAAANAEALAMAQTQAASQLVCTWWNSPQTKQVVCEANPAITASATVAAHTYSSTISQADADNQAMAEATNQANEELAATCFGVPAAVLNTEQHVQVVYLCQQAIVRNCTIIVNVTIPANRFAGNTQVEANNAARSWGAVYGNTIAQYHCARGECGAFNVTYGVVT